MRVSTLFLLVLGLAGVCLINAGPVRQSRALNFEDEHQIHKSALYEDFKDFISLIPTDKVEEIFLEYLKTDKELLFVIDYVQTKEFMELVKAVENIPDVIKFYDYLQASGLDVYYVVNAIHEFIGLPPLKPGSMSRKITGGVAGLIADIKAVLPLEDIKALYHEKLVSSVAFKNLVERLHSPKFQEVIDALIANEEFQKILAHAKSFGIDVKAITDLLTTLFGLEFPHHTSKKSTRTLQDDLEDFIALVPKKELTQVVFEYLEKDAEVKFVIEYVQSDGFRELVLAMESIPDLINFYKYVQESGLDIYYAVNKIHEFIGLPPLVPTRSVVRITEGVAGLIADVKALLPLEEIKALYHKKLETSPEFKKLIERLQSPKFQEVLDALIANEEFQKILAHAKSFGIDVKAVTDLLSTIFGLEFPHHASRKSTRTLHDDLEDFIALVPKKELTQVVFEYLEKDAEVKFVIEYVQSDGFRELVLAMESIPDLINFYKYVQESGLDIYYAVNKIHEFIGLPPLVPTRSVVRITGGVAGLIADVKALLPLEEIKALYHKKLETSPEFKKLIERLQSPKFQEVVDALIANEEFQKILAHAKSFGIDVKAITDLLTTLFGLEFPHHASRKSTRTLHDDLEDFIALVPKKELTQVVFEYLEKDAEVKFVIEYVQSDGFRELVLAMESIPDLINFYKYVQESGLDIYYAVNKIHEFIGLPPLVPTRSVVRITGGVAGLIADVKALLPLEEIKALYHKKLETSPEFKKLIERLQSPKFQEVVDALIANEEFQKILAHAKSFGIDVKAITDLLTTLFGLEFPHHASRKSTRTLHDDLEDFIALVPKKELTQVVFEYLEKDAEVKFVIEYVQSDGFRELVLAMESIPDLINFYKYVQESGLDIYYAVNKIHEFIGLPPLVPTRSVVRITGGVAGLIADVKALLPLEEIKALYHKKLETSPEFKKLIERLQSPKFQEVVDALIANEEFQKILAHAKSFGIDVKAVTDLLSTIFGLEFPHKYLETSSRTLRDDFEDFLSFVPTEEALKIFFEYLEKDQEVQFVVKYIQSVEFQKLVKNIENIPDVIEFYNYLQKSGLDVYYVVNKLHEFMGLPPLKPSRTRAITGGVVGLIADIKALLPLEDIKALYYEKLETSHEFKYFIDRLQSPKFQAVINDLIKNNEFQRILTQAEKFGIDVKAIFDFISTILGLDISHLKFVQTKSTLHEDLEDFMELIPREKVMTIFFKYMASDRETIHTIEYMQSNNFKNLVHFIEDMPDVINFYNYLEESGLDIYSAVNRFHDIIEIPHVLPTPARAVRITGGVAGLIANIKAVLPHDQIKALYYKKLATSPSFKIFIARLRSDKFQAIINALLTNKDFQHIIASAKKVGIDVAALTDLLTTIFGIQWPYGQSRRPSAVTRTLQTDFEDFVELLPFDDIVAISLDYILHDAQVQEAVKYLKSDEFRKLIIKLQNDPEVYTFLVYFEKSGANIIQLFNVVNELLGLPLIPEHSVSRFGGGVHAMIEDIRAILPKAQIHALYDEKMETSEEFKHFIRQLKDPEFQKIIDKMVLNENVIELGHQAFKHGISIENIVQFLGDLLGLQFPESPNFPNMQLRDLASDLENFVQLLPLEAMLEVTVTYLANDKEVQAIIVYLRSEKFTRLIDTLHNIPEYQYLLNELRTAGLDVDLWIDIIHELIGWTTMRTTNSRDFSSEMKPGLAGLIKSLKDLLPREEIKALYHEKLEKSKEFAKLINLISSDKFQTLTNVLFTNKDFQDVLHEAQAHGVNLQIVSDLFFQIFGITTPSGIINYY